MGSNIVHQYFKKDLKDSKILLKVDPVHYKAIEITVVQSKVTQITESDIDTIEALIAEGFNEVNAMEFNLYEAGLL